MCEPVKGPPTSSAAELQAAARAIEIAAKRGISNLCMYTDSETVRNAMRLIPDRREDNWQRFNEYKNQWERVGDRNNFELLESTIKKYPNVKVEFEHVRRYSHNLHNEQAHFYAKEGAKQFRNIYSTTNIYYNT